MEKEKPGTVEKIAGWLGSPETKTVEVRYPGGRTEFISLNEAARMVRACVDFELAKPTARLARQILAVYYRNCDDENVLDQLRDLHAGNELDRPWNRVMTWKDLFY